MDCDPQPPMTSSNDTIRYNRGGLEAFSRFTSRYHGYAVVIVCAWGVVANAANVAVLTRRKMASPTNLILTWLAIADVLTMLTCMPTTVHFYIMRDDELPVLATRSVGWIRYFILHVNLTVAWHTIAVWLTITLAIFRFVFINFPFDGAVFCTTLRAKVAIGSVWVSTFLLCIPNYLTVEIREFNQNLSVPLESKPVEEMVEDETTALPPLGNRCVIVEDRYFAVGDRNGVLFSINFWIHALFFKLIPCLLLTVLTFLLVKVMHDSHRRRVKLESLGRHEESTKTREHNRTTTLLFAVVCLFLVTELPHGVLTLCNIFIRGFHSEVYEPLGDLLDFIALLNNSINFVIYCTMSNKFRETFVELFCQGLGRKRCCSCAGSWSSQREPGGVSSERKALHEPGATGRREL